ARMLDPRDTVQHGPLVLEPGHPDELALRRPTALREWRLHPDEEDAAGEECGVLRGADLRVVGAGAHTRELLGGQPVGAGRDEEVLARPRLRFAPVRGPDKRAVEQVTSGVHEAGGAEAVRNLGDIPGRGLAGDRLVLRFRNDAAR